MVEDAAEAKVSFGLWLLLLLLSMFVVATKGLLMMSGSAVFVGGDVMGGLFWRAIVGTCKI